MTSDSTAAYAAIQRLRLGLPANRTAAEVDYVPRDIVVSDGIGGKYGPMSVVHTRDSVPPRYRIATQFAPDYGH